MNKKIKILVIMLIYSCLILFSTDVFATSTGKTTNDTTRLRKEASTKSSTVLLISINEEVEIVSKEGEWYKVKYKDGKTTYTGYIREDLLEVDGKVEEQEEQENQKTEEQDPENQTTEEQTEQEKTEESSNSQSNTATEQNTPKEEQNIESEKLKENEKVTIKNNIDTKLLPLINSSSTGTIEANTEITVTEIIGNWCYIETATQSGWTMKSKVEKDVETENNNDTESEENQTDENNQTTSNTDTTDTNVAESSNNTDASTTTSNEAKTLYVNVSTVNMREKTETTSKILKQLSLNTQVTVIEVVDSTWTKVKVSGVTGYIASKYLSETKTKETTSSRGAEETRTISSSTSSNSDSSTSSSTSSNSDSSTSSSTSSNSDSSSSSSTSSNSDSSASSSTSSNSDSSSSSNTSSTSSSTSNNQTTGSDIVAYAKKYLGYSYVLGGTTPSGGFDCSGYVQYVYKHFGYSISRTSYSQRSDGKEVKKENLQQGDIVCFNGHVGIYIGEGDFIHAANSKKGVIITSLSDSYYVKNYITARRIL